MVSQALAPRTGDCPALCACCSFEYGALGRQKAGALFVVAIGAIGSGELDGLLDECCLQSFGHVLLGFFCIHGTATAAWRVQALIDGRLFEYPCST